MIPSHYAAILVLFLSLQDHATCAGGIRTIRRRFDFSKLAGRGFKMPDGAGGASGGLPSGLGGWGALGRLGSGSSGAASSGSLGGRSGGIELSSLFSGAGGLGGGGGFASTLGGGDTDASSILSSTSTSTSADSSTPDASSSAKEKKTQPSTEPTPAGCKAYIIIAARGTMEGPSGSISYNELEQKILAAVPGGAKEELQYSTSAEYSYTVTQGAQTGVNMIKTELAKCPKTVYVLIGYSKGAMVQTQVLSSKSIPLASIAAVVLFGNPYFKAGARQNKCTAKSGAGVAAVLNVKIPEDITENVYDCCAVGDMMCQTAGSIVAHLGYGQQFAAGALEFVVQKLQAKLGKK